MKNFKFIILFLICSCSTKKDIVYLQNSSSNKTYQNSYSDYLIQRDDILKISVYTENPELSPFNHNSKDVNPNKDTVLFNGFQVNSNGEITFPLLGKVSVVDKTINHIQKILTNSIIQEGILTSPQVDIKLVNGHFTIVGEVNRPGKYDFLENNLNIFEAIGMAGDLTITGRRDNIKLIRENNAQKIVKSLDMTDPNILNDEYFQIKSGDIIIVNPNKTRIKNAGIIGNSGTLITLLSFVLSSLIVINN